MSLSDVLTRLRADPKFMRNVSAWERLPARPARYAPWPQGLTSEVIEAVRAGGIDQLFTHQALAIEAALRGESVAVVTGTASGKTLCYNLPVLDALLRDPTARALYLFPTKALAQDQMSALEQLVAHLPASSRAAFRGRDGQRMATYDGDTPRSRRASIRRQVRLLITNPDMLHTGILPHHTRWADFFDGLRYVVIDEMHSYRGVFGSHAANLLRRLRRICTFYGAAPRFLLTSATIANPAELAERLIASTLTLVPQRQDGSPRGEKHFILYNPPLVDPSLGIRRSVTLEARDIAGRLLGADVQTILFARARLTTEVLLGYLRDRAVVEGIAPAQVQGYRGGYLPLERREIEQGLREGSVRAVVATNALELGVDIGQLAACIMTGYPGTIASTWQQAGRAGRRSEVSLAILVSSPAALDQFMVRHPDYFFGRSPERALMQPDNLLILLDHLRCAAFELPFEEGEGFGDCQDVPALLDFLAQEEATLHHSCGVYRWVAEGYPAAEVSLRKGGAASVLVIDVSDGAGTVIGQVDRPSAPMLVHEGAIYLHGGEAFGVERLDWENGQAFVRRSDADYYTDASLEQRVEVLRTHAQTDPTGQKKPYGRARGELQVTSEAVGYRQIKRYTHETLGWGDIDLPEQTMMTTGFWLWIGGAALEALYAAGVLLAPINYGPNWPAQRAAARQRDGYRCRTCGVPEGSDRQHDVHHLRPFREFGYIPGENDLYRQANALDNLITLCPRCHRRAETARRVRGALGGLAHALQQLAPLYLMCDPRDIGCVVESRSAHTARPTITMYDQVPGGIGLCVQLEELCEEWLRATRDLILHCDCHAGCPACVGPVENAGVQVKPKTLRLTQVLLGEVVL